MPTKKKKDRTSGKKGDGILKYRFLYTVIIVFVYMLGRSIPLFGIDMSVSGSGAIDAEALLEQTISGDRYSLFALGISPYMIASVLTQMAVAFRKAGTKDKISPRSTNRVMLILTMLFAVFQAAVLVQELPFKAMELPVLAVRGVAAAELTAGAVMILWLSSRNKKYGIGGQTTLIYINILDGIITNLTGHGPEELVLPLTVSLAALILMNVMESTEKRIPVQRISIHNIYADKNYLAVKLNPVGVMPVMFATAFLMLPRLLLAGLGYLFPDNGVILWWEQNLILTRPVGIGAYVLTLYLLTIGFAMIFIGPGELSEQLLKSGDSLRDFHAGKETRRYLTREIRRLSFFSATVMSLCMGLPMLFQLTDGADRTLVMLPASVMMLTGIWYNLREEFAVLKAYDSYRTFI